MLFRAVAGLIHPTEGAVKAFGKKIGEDVSFPESMGLVIESVGFWPYYTGFENLKILASIKNTISDEDIRRAIERVGLDPNDKRTYAKYSLGMKQRLGIAQAVMEKPDLILLAMKSSFSLSLPPTGPFLPEKNRSKSEVFTIPR